MNPSITKSVGLLLAIPLLSTAILTGCKSPTMLPPPRTGSLTTYNNLEPVGEGAWRFVNRDRLSRYKKFMIRPITVIVSDYKDRKVTEEGRRAASDGMRMALTKALSDAYPVVNTPGADVAEIALTITDAYKTGGKVGLSIEGEVIDSYSSVQIAAVIRTELGKRYLGNWWEKTAAREMMDSWAQRFRQGVDQAHGK